MEEKNFKKARLENVTIPQNREFLRNALINSAATKKKSFFNFAPVKIGAAAFAVVLAAVFMVVEDNNNPGQTNNLGGVWSTYDDSAEGNNSVVWPQAPKACENLFEKSAPGFGGKGYAVRVTGNAGDKAKTTLGVNTYLSEHASCPRCSGINITMFKGIKFKMKGNIAGGALYFILPHESGEPDENKTLCQSLTDNNDYTADISGLVKSEWTDVKLDFYKSFKQPKGTTVKIDKVLENANRIKWEWKGNKGEKMDIWIDEIQFY
ncbi:MAG: hypothetical protein CVV21_12530 [Candidatus Goldiibacteriota bacterium HGW-Goldbacteria-1]|jgi:hypothetical protein|nr:MAG: hypothetical protein CVV21_12530 [Candidatus Goldiibacteriota bacterium HGW-Goldbacteria-1]